jgi:hypothetical protein
MAYLLITILLLATVTTGVAQSSQKKMETQPKTQPSSVEPFAPKQEYQPKKQKPTTKTTYNARDKFYDRMEQVAKANRKTEKELQKPQYSDPSYFGHKKPPKRRPNGQLKYCKECGIRH